MAPLCTDRSICTLENYQSYIFQITISIWRSAETTKESSQSRFYKKHECCYNVDFTRGRKALCDTRCNTFLHSVLLCAYTDYYDHCDYYDDGNFFHNSPLLHSLLHDAIMMLLHNNQYDRLAFTISSFLFCDDTHLHVYTYTHIYTHTCKRHHKLTQQTFSNNRYVQHQQHQCSTRSRQKRFSSCKHLLDAFYILETLLRLSSSFIEQGN